MGLSDWLTFLSICIAATVSPGFSTAVILRNTIQGSRTQGLLCVAAHSIGILTYAFATALGLSVLIVGSKVLYQGLSLICTLYILWLGIQTFRKSGYHFETAEQSQLIPMGQSVKEGFLSATLNPKTAFFYLSIFSQFIHDKTSLAERIIMPLARMLCDFIWYTLVVLLATQHVIKQLLCKQLKQTNQMLGIFLMLMAMKLLADVLIF
ncbi:MAG: LysE family translocator [Endozoicomonas sp.]|uniref:LysE family translocator n=1 Tax=Endozoicomonas sp. TaxID=1892382 RepID=UPI003D9B8F71